MRVTTTAKGKQERYPPYASSWTGHPQHGDKCLDIGSYDVVPWCDAMKQEAEAPSAHPEGKELYLLAGLAQAHFPES